MRRTSPGRSLPLVEHDEIGVRAGLHAALAAHRGDRALEHFRRKQGRTTERLDQRRPSCRHSRRARPNVPAVRGWVTAALRLWQQGAPLTEALRPHDVASCRSAPGCGSCDESRGTRADRLGCRPRRVQRGATDRATSSESTRPSSGIAHVIVGGTFVSTRRRTRPSGRPVRASPMTRTRAPRPSSLTPRRRERGLSAERRRRRSRRWT